ncbi:T9SS type A sorting domain-containing protein [Maribellus sp. CM-23]|uniref:T9SS type A sorting domain-containing protein n=1 Tax=Maribellus sp. CM-23 TaxID=2781026 RepID=UPI001F3560AD|nr:T9SS type A sorting domain-containing protein [Maribellus sp. CM-23]MCE4565545.1 T9SS type A sorting domain-containing protein [Maribellus sp. CM-23]
MRNKLPAVKRVLLAFSISVIALYSSAQIQSVTAASGAYLQGKNITVSYTLGETIITTLEKPDLKITQGFHQTNLLVTAIDELEKLAVKIEAYPNPVRDNLNLVLSEMLPAETSYELYNSFGSLIIRRKLDALNTKISFQNLGPAVYILKVHRGATTLKTFKIIKR